VGTAFAGHGFTEPHGFVVTPSQGAHRMPA
jgi:hypothetical protein